MEGLRGNDTVLDGKDESTEMLLRDADDLRRRRIVVDERNTISQAVIDELLGGRFSLIGLSTNRAKARVSAISGDVDGDDGSGASRVLEAYEELLVP